MSKNVVVIGGGPAGYTAALRASQLGAKVTLIEATHLGGTCLNVGCIPTKSLVESSHLWKKGQYFFQNTEEKDIPWNQIIKRKNEAIQQLRGGIKKLLAAGKVDVISGTASLNQDGVDVISKDGKKKLAADVTIIATGSRPIVPPIPGVQLEGVMTSDDIVSLNDSYPDTIAILGAGVIGIEFATIFSELGKKVVIIEAGPTVLPMLDTQIANHLKEKLEEDGVCFYINEKVEAIKKNNYGLLELKLSNQERIQISSVLLAVGRKPQIEHLNLNRLGIDVEKGRIKTNEFYQTSVNHVYAVGDCSSPMMLAHSAMAEARVAVEHALGYPCRPLVYEYIPQCIYSHPEIATVGITVLEAEKRGFDVQEGIFPLAASGRALVERETVGFLKVVSEKKYGRVLGVHLIAPYATEMIAEACLALTLEATTDELVSTIHPHPTIAEGIPEAINVMTGEAIHLIGGK